MILLVFLVSEDGGIIRREHGEDPAVYGDFLEFFLGAFFALLKAIVAHRFSTALFAVMSVQISFNFKEFIAIKLNGQNSPSK